MPFYALRDYLDKLEQENQLVRVSKQVAPEPDLRAIGRAAFDMGEATSPAVLIDNILGYKGKRVVMNVHGSWANYAIAMDMPKSTTLKQMFYELADRWDNPGEVKWVQNAPCQEVKITENINLYEILPLFRINLGDGGFYLSKAATISRDPDDPDNFDKENIGLYRLQVQGPDTIGIQALPFHDIGSHIRKAEEMGKPLPVVICLGMQPMLTVMACVPLPYGKSEFKAASALNGAPEELTKALTCDLDVPAGTEYVIEGEIIPRQRFPEGPFGEMPGSYSGVRFQSRIKVKAVTHRKNPIFENLYVGKPWTEHEVLIGLATSAPLYKQLRETMPEVTAVNAMYQHGLTIIVAANNKFGGYAKSVAMRLASTPHGISYAKNIIIVDGDVDPFDLKQVMWAFSTRIRATKDVIVIPNTPGMPLDPSSEPPGMGNKLIIDATTPAPPEPVLREVKMVGNVEQAAAFQQLLTELWQDQA